MEELMKFSMDDVLCRLAKEASYYLAFFDFADAMQERGYSFCMPESGNKIGICAGYDLAMAVESDRPVVANDFHMDDGEYFCVITGANGGGKTTFARMIGQILYFDRMGLLVPCDRAVLPHYENIFSHFSNEESEMSGRGKLVEELERLQPMMTAEQTDSFVILNELFTTAATLDAGIMGKKVLEHFMKNNCHGIYVTHIQSLAEERDGIVSMVAELEKDHHTRSFKITRKPAKEGEYEDSIITRYHMTYEQMREVIGRGN
jgi:DNA mismatch repair ATPase MutS